jgi:hypothetical protein
MNLDILSIAIMTALVVNVSGVVFIVDTLIRRDDGAGRVWTLAFLAGMLTTIAYIVWAYDRSSWWAVAVGNAAFVAGTGLMWLGCRSFNGRRMTAASAAVGATVLGVGIAALAEGPDGGDWAGALAMFLGLLVFATLGAIECLRGQMGRIRTSWGLAFVLGLQAVYYAVRTPVFVLAGPDSAIFQEGFGTVNTSFLTVILTIVAVVVTSVLRAGRTSLRGRAAPSLSLVGEDGIAPLPAFERMLGEVSARARARGELVGVIAVRIEDLDQISTAFGREAVAAVVDTWRSAVRSYAPSMALVGEDGPMGIVVGIQPASEADARRQAALVYRGVFDELGQVSGAVIPVVGVGVGLSDVAGYEVDDLMGRARDAAQRAALSIDASVLVAEDDSATGSFSVP